jgi:hypothetical protein
MLAISDNIHIGLAYVVALCRKDDMLVEYDDQRRGKNVLFHTGGPIYKHLSLPADFTQWIPDEKEPTSQWAFRVSAIADVQFVGDTAAVNIPLLPPVHVTHPNIQSVLSFGAPDTILHPK